MKTRAIFLTFVAFFTLAIVSCTEDIDMSARYVFKERTAVDYLRDHEQYSEYCKLLQIMPVSSVSQTTLWQLLSARGNYTVFAPTNEAIQAYLEELAAKEDFLTEPSWDAFTDSTKLDSIRKEVVLNSIIDFGGQECCFTWDFPTANNAEIKTPNMHDRKLTVQISNKKDQPDLMINNSPIDEQNRDIYVTNGCIHCMLKVVLCDNTTLGRWADDIIKNKKEGYYVASMLLGAAGLLDTLNATEDDAYLHLYEAGTFTEYSSNVPKHRYYGFTYFAEPDELWSELLGKPALEITEDDVMEYLVDNNIYPEATHDKDYRSEDNLLNQFVTYHLQPRRIAPDQLVMHYNDLGYVRNTNELNVAFCEYYTSMGKRRLLKIFESKESNGVYLNRFPNLDNGRRGTYHELSCDPEKVGVRVGGPTESKENINLRNAFIYPIDKLLLYDEEVRKNLGRERIRYDFMAISPETTNNDIRMKKNNTNVSIAPDAMYPYLSEFSLSKESRFLYQTGYLKGWANYDGDEILILGYQDVIVRLPPVPVRDTYELRYENSNHPSRGMFQFFFGTDPESLAPAGIPLDLRIGGQTFAHNDKPSFMGWETDTEDDDYNIERDKMLHNHGYMKAPNVFTTGSAGVYPARTNPDITRRVLLKATMDPDETYYLRFKLCMDDDTKQLFMDFLEVCPKSVYDNPNEPEDIW